MSLKLFRWDGNRVLSRTAKLGVAAALLSWVVVGTAATYTGHLRSALPDNTGYKAITPEQIESIRYDDLPGDNELYTRLAPPFTTPERPDRLGEIVNRLRGWPPAHLEDPEQRVRNLLCIASIADVTADPLEGEIARVVFDQIREPVFPEELKQILARIILFPDEGTVVATAPDFGWSRVIQEKALRERNMYYAKKLLGRLVGRITE